VATAAARGVLLTHVAALMVTTASTTAISRIVAELASQGTGQSRRARPPRYMRMIILPPVSRVSREYQAADRADGATLSVSNSTAMRSQKSAKERI